MEKLFFVVTVLVGIRIRPVGWDRSVWLQFKVREHTFWDSKECNNDDSILLATAQAVMEIAKRQVERVILGVSGHDGNSRLVATKENRDKEGTMISRILCQSVLNKQFEQ